MNRSMSKTTNSNQTLRRLLEDIRFAFYAILHPIDAFDGIKWEGKGSLTVSGGILVLLVLQTVMTRQNTGFAYNHNNLETLNIFTILLATVGIFVLWFISSVGISRLMFGEGTARQIWITLTYSLLPSILVQLIIVGLTNVVSLEMQAFLVMFQIVGYLWTALMVYSSVFIIQQFSFARSFLNLFLSFVGVLIVMFILLLLYSLTQQIVVFIRTITNELLFRL